MTLSFTTTEEVPKVDAEVLSVGRVSHLSRVLKISSSLDATVTVVVVSAASDSSDSIALSSLSTTTKVSTIDTWYLNRKYTEVDP